MKKILMVVGVVVVLVIIAVAIYLLVIAPGFVGHTGKDGAILKEYVTPEKLKELTESPREDIWIVDVRPESAWKKGHIPTAKNFPSTSITNRLAELPKDKYLILQCETGGRVEMVIKQLQEHGYTKFMNWGGFYRWPYKTTKHENAKEIKK